MKFLAIIRETVRDIASGTSKTATSFFLFTALLGLLTAHELSSVAALLDAAQKYQDVGGNVRIVIAENRIDGIACASLSYIHNIDSAALRSVTEQLRATSMSTVPLAHFAATPGIAELLDVRSVDGNPVHKSGAYVGAQVTEQFGATAAIIPTNLGALTAAGVYQYPDDGRRGGLGFAAITPEISNTNLYDECWIRAWPEHPDSNALLTSTVLPTLNTEDAQPEITQLNTTLGQRFHGQTQFINRISRFDSFVALFASAMLAFIIVKNRRLALASALHAGLAVSTLMRIQLLQQAAWIVMGSCFVLACSLLTAGYYPEAVNNLWQLAARTTLLAALGAFTGVALATVSVREHALFTYFKQRD